MKNLIRKILKEEIDKSVINKISANDKIHISKEDGLKFKNVPISEQPVYFKPKGLWFSFGTEWVDFIDREYTRNNHSLQNVYDIKTNDSTILTLGKENEEQFLNKYGIRNKYDNMDVDWSKVATDWDGVEIIINPRELNERMLWSTWDIPSGCIWNIKGITSIRKL
jgi:hypothetical protein